MEDNFTTRFARALLREIWKDLLEPVMQAIKWDRVMCTVDVRRGKTILFATIYDDDSPAEVEICRQDFPEYDKRGLPNIEAAVSEQLKGFWSYAEDKAFIRNIDDAGVRIRRYEKEHSVSPAYKK